MKPVSMSKPTALALGFLLLWALSFWAHPAWCDEGKVAWMTYDQAVQAQKKEAKPILLFAHLTYCYRCKEMKRKVYTNAEVQKLLNSKFLPALADMSKEKSLESRFKINYMPTHIFFSPQGKPVLRVKGVIPLERFLAMLRFVSQGAYKRMDFQAYQDGRR